MKVGDKVWHISWAGKDSVLYDCVFQGRHKNGNCVVNVKGIDLMVHESNLYTDLKIAKCVYDDYMEELAKLRKVVIIGSSGLKAKMMHHKGMLESAGHCVFMPAFDDHPAFTTLELCEHNRQLIKAADIVHIIWDGRSTGTLFDFGMAFALNKRAKIIYLEPRTFVDLMKSYEESF